MSFARLNDCSAAFAWWAMAASNLGGRQSLSAIAGDGEPGGAAVSSCRPAQSISNEHTDKPGGSSVVAHAHGGIAATGPPGVIPPIKGPLSIRCVSLSRATFRFLLSKLFDASRRYFSPLTQICSWPFWFATLSTTTTPIISETTMGFAEVTVALVDAYLPQELHIPAYFCGFNIFWTYVVAVVTGNASQVDRVGLCLLLPRFVY